MLPNGRHQDQRLHRVTTPRTWEHGTGSYPMLIWWTSSHPADTVHPLPDLDNTVKTLFYWAMDLDIRMAHGWRC